ncbi:hypothetical protein WJX81_001603 [Elliptochloris bilobata]|uniref:Uncharacterized protein n=1 Tax=Elliptochloris bilobata TaxID=381761 RepID=A0AAW1S0Q7_9CHLO
MPPLRGILAETATTGLVRYPWPLQRALYAHALSEVLAHFESEAAVEVGPPALLPGGESGEAARRRLRGDLEAFGEEAPFTLQRLAEVLLEPRKQYARLDKLVLALEKLLLVTSTVPAAAAPPPRPPLASLPPVNENPAPAQPPRGASAITRVPESPADDPVSPSADSDAGDAAAFGNGQLTGRSGGGVGVGFGIAGAALATTLEAVPNGTLGGEAPGAAADGPTAMEAMTTDPLAGPPLMAQRNGVVLPAPL